MEIYPRCSCHNIPDFLTFPDPCDPRSESLEEGGNGSLYNLPNDELHAPFCQCSNNVNSEYNCFSQQGNQDAPLSSFVPNESNETSVKPAFLPYKFAELLKVDQKEEEVTKAISGFARLRAVNDISENPGLCIHLLNQKPRGDKPSVTKVTQQKVKQFVCVESIGKEKDEMLERCTECTSTPCDSGMYTSTQQVKPCDEIDSYGTKLSYVPSIIKQHQGFDSRLSGHTEIWDDKVTKSNRSVKKNSCDSKIIDPSDDRQKVPQQNLTKEPKDQEINVETS